MASDPFPPVACTSLYNTLKRAGYNPVFYNIDSERPTLDQLEEYFKREHYDIVGISAVASTGYKYTKTLSTIIRNASPKTQIILGGNLASSCGILLRKCPIDICVIGEGEKVLVNLMKYYEKNGSLHEVGNELSTIKGISYITNSNEVITTEEECPLTGDEIEEPDYDVIAKYTNVNKYLLDPMQRHDFLVDPRTYDAHRKGMKIAEVVTSKGCVNNCTFCHRWIKGYKMIPVKKIIDHMKYLKEKYHVGYFVIQVEYFTENQQWLNEFMEKVKALDVLFIIGGARVSFVQKSTAVLKRLKDAGMTAIYFGMESGSSKILKVMAKNATREDNIHAMKACGDADVFTTIQLVIGMPGENEQTIQETIEFVKESTRNLPYPPSLSINYLQSLPGTPTYEYMRVHGMLGTTLDEEEKYLINVSDMNASDFRQYMNVTESPLSEVKSWQLRIEAEAHINWLSKRNWSMKAVPTNYKRLIAENYGKRMILYRIIHIFGDLFWLVFKIRNIFKLYTVARALGIVIGMVKEDNRDQYKVNAESLRDIVSMDKYDNIAHSR